MSLAESIKIARQKAFLSQEAFAKELQVALSTVNRWEKGKAKPNFSAMKEMKCFCNKHNISYIEIEEEWLQYSAEESSNE